MVQDGGETGNDVLTAKKPRNYISNKEMMAEIVAYQTAHHEALKRGEEPPRCPDSIGRMIVLICTRLADRWNFVGYSWKDEMISEGTLNCSKAVLKFNSRKSSNPHAYFSTIAFNSFRKIIGVEQRQNATKHVNLDYLNLFDEMMPANAASSPAQSDGLQRHYDVIERFERTLADKKKKLTRKKVATKKKVAVKKRVATKRGKSE